MSESRRPIAIDLFAGAGGLSLGLEQAGFDVVAAVEYDPIHAAIHELNFPLTKVICDDVRNLSRLDEAALRDRLGVGDREIDLIAGGPPCQGFSLIGHRVLDDPRNSLVFDFFTIVVRLRPRTFVMENVPGMATGKHNQLLDELKDRFREIGYRLREPVQILNAAQYGVPQNRRRLFLLGARDDMPLPEYPAPRYAIRGNGKPRAQSELSEFGPSVWDAIGELPDIEDFDSLFGTDRLALDAPLEEGSVYAQRLRGDLDDPEDFSYRRRHDPAVLTGCLRARHTDLSRLRFGATEPGTTEPISRFFRLPPDGLSNTLRAGTASDRGAFTAPRPIHPVSARCISVREAARLHSFPDWFRFHRSIWHGFRQIGNAVPPILGRAVGQSVIAATGADIVRPLDVLEPGPRFLAAVDMSGAAAHFGVPRSRIAPRMRSADRAPEVDSRQVKLAFGVVGASD